MEDKKTVTQGFIDTVSFECSWVLLAFAGPWIIRQGVNRWRLYRMNQKYPQRVMLCKTHPEKEATLSFLLPILCLPFLILTVGLTTLKVICQALAQCTRLSSSTPKTSQGATYASTIHRQGNRHVHPPLSTFSSFASTGSFKPPSVLRKCTSFSPSCASVVSVSSGSRVVFSQDPNTGSLKTERYYYDPRATPMSKISHVPIRLTKSERDEVDGPRQPLRLRFQIPPPMQVQIPSKKKPQVVQDKENPTTTTRLSSFDPNTTLVWSSFNHPNSKQPAIKTARRLSKTETFCNLTTKIDFDPSTTVSFLSVQMHKRQLEGHNLYDLTPMKRLKPLVERKTFGKSPSRLLAQLPKRQREPQEVEFLKGMNKKRPNVALLQEREREAMGMEFLQQMNRKRTKLAVLQQRAS